MNTNKTYTITIDTECKVSVEANGFKGGSCKEATQPIIDKLSGGSGADGVEFAPKPEINEIDLTPNQLNQRL